MAQIVMNLPAMRETLVWSLGKTFWRRKWQPTPVFFPGKSHGQGSLAGYIQSMQSQRVGHNLATEQQQYYTGKLLRVNPKSSHHKGKYFFLFFKFCIYMKWWMFTKLMIIISKCMQIIMYTLNLSSAVCQWYLNKTGSEERKNVKSKWTLRHQF